MEIFYVSRLCSHRKFDALFMPSQIKPQQQAQKFHYMFASGLAEQEGVQLTAISDLPISRVINKRIWWPGSFETENNINVSYLPHLNMSVIGHIIAFWSTFLTTAKWCIANRNNTKYIFCDGLTLTISIAAKTVAKLFSVKVMAIVTDVPCFMQAYTRGKKAGLKSIFIDLYTSLCSYFLMRYNAYVIVTEQLNELVNP